MPLTAEPLKLMPTELVPLQTVCGAKAESEGVGLTVRVKFCAVPLQPLAAGITLMLPEIGLVPLLVPMKLAIVPLPAAAKPIAVLVLLQL